MPTPNEDNFEKQWRDAFEDAEVAPSPVVWAGLEPHLPKSVWVTWFRYSGLGFLSLILLVGIIFFFHREETSKTTNHQIPTTHHKPLPTNKRQNSNPRFDTNKNLQNIDNQFIHKEQNLDNSLRAIKYQQNSNPQFDTNKNLQNTDNQSVIKLSNPGDKPLVINERHSLNTKFDTNEKSQNTDNRVVIKSLSLDHNPLATDEKHPSKAKFDTNKNPQNTDNQVAIKLQNTDNEPLTIDERQNSNPRLDTNKNFQNIDNQLVTKKRTLIIVDLLPNKTISVDNSLVKRDMSKQLATNQTLAQSPTRQRFAVLLGLMPNIFQPKVSANYRDYLNIYLQTHQQSNVDASNFFRGLQEQNQTEISYSIHLYMHYALSPKWQVRTGLQYIHNRNRLITNAFFVNQGNGETASFWQNMISGNLSNPNFVQAIHNHPTYKPSEINTFELANFNDAQSIQIKNEFYYLSIPIQMGHQIRNSRHFNFTAWAGLGMDIFLKNTVQSQALTYNSQQFTSQNSGYQRVNWSGLLNFSIQYRYNAHWSWIAEPGYRFALQTYSQPNTMLQFHPRNWGINLGIQYSF